MRTQNSISICVTGDLVTDWFLCNLPKTSEHFDPILSVPVSGGAWFAADVLKSAMESSIDIDYTLVSHDTNKSLATAWNSSVSQSTWNIRLYPESPEKPKSKVFRLEHLNGYNRECFDDNSHRFPMRIHGQRHGGSEAIIDTLPDTYDLLVIDDMHLGFREERRSEEWKSCLSRLSRCGVVILIISGNTLPLEGEKIPELWEYLLSNYNNRTICIVSANSLRNAGATISRRISWEATAEDFLLTVDSVSCMAGFDKMLVRFGVTGVIDYRRSPKRVCTLYYDPVATDGVFRDRKTEGNIIGHNSICAAWMARAMAGAKDLLESDLDAGIEQVVNNSYSKMIKSSQIFYRHGYGKYIAITSGSMPIQYSHDMDALSHLGVYNAFKQSNCFNYQTTLDRQRWNRPSVEVTLYDEMPMNIFAGSQKIRDAGSESIDSIIEAFAIRIVEYGIDRAISEAHLEMPIARFGSIVALDRGTIESYRQLEARIRDYVLDVKKDKPLNLAVFGAPGSGKSFTVSQIAASANPSIKMLTCNLTQMGNDHEYLNRELLRVLDENRQGQLPLMMFDEFECDEFEHLKRFLEPMEDGTFMFRDRSLHLGRCIFVFAGGVAINYQQFLNGVDEKKNKTLKLPDFASRLLGHINLLGMNKEDDPDMGASYIVRRAILLRAFLEKLGLVERDVHGTTLGGKANIDLTLVKSLLVVHKYIHGARSMRAVLYMCNKIGNRISNSGIPPYDYVKMHIVDHWNFIRAMQNRTLLDTDPNTNTAVT